MKTCVLALLFTFGTCFILIATWGGGYYSDMKQIWMISASLNNTMVVWSFAVSEDEEA